MKDMICQNCYSRYAPEDVRCSDCGASQGKKDDGFILFTESVRDEISRFGGIMHDIIPISFERYIIPCEWGVIFFDNKNRTSWCYLCGIVVAVVVHDYVEVSYGKNKDTLSIDKGELIKREKLA